MNNITLREVKTRRDLRTFIFLPEKIHRNYVNWMPPLYSDEWILHDPKKNRSFHHCDYIRLIAWKDGEPVGRIMGLINRKYNEMKSEKSGRFCFLECYNDSEISHLLISAVEEWSRGHGMDHIIGPYAFSDKDPQGCQMSGFETPGKIAAPNNDSYLSALIEKEGYKPEVELVEYVADVPREIPELYRKVMERATAREHVQIIEFSSKRELKPYIVEILEVLNDTFKNIYGFVPLSDREKIDFARRYLPVLDPKYIKAAKINGEIVGFVIAMPDLGSAMMKVRGRLFPFGFIHILRAVKRSKDLLMLLGGIKERYRGRGIDAIMGSRILESAAAAGMQTLDSHLVLAENRRMRAEYERIGGKISKTFTIYGKDL